MSFSPEKIARLRAMSKKIRRLPKVVAAMVAEVVAPEITAVAKETFDAGENAYGNAWAPGKKGQHVTLVKTGDLERGIAFVAAGGRIKVRLGVKYAKYQIGKRPVFPRKGAALPASYLDVLKTAAKAILSKESTP